MSNEYPNPTNPAPIHGKIDHYDCDMETGTISYHVVKTNADRIRSMTDEELAEWIVAHSCPVAVCNERLEDNHVDCHSCWLEWLKAEVGE
jgi:hypothetical protein